MPRLAFVLLIAACCLSTALADPPSYPEHLQLSYFLTESGERHEIRSVADWLIRRDHVLLHLQRVMGPLPTPRIGVPLDLREKSRETLEHVERRKISYCTDSPTQRVFAWLIMPRDDRRTPRPAMLCLHQTTKVGKDEPAGVGGTKHLNYALELAEHGFVTLAPDYPTLGEYEYDFDADSYASGSMKAIYDNIRAIDLLQGLPEVDPDRIGCIGHSLGGHNSIFTAVFDVRVKAVVSSCGFTRFHKYYAGDLTGWSGPRYMPRIATDYDKDPNHVPFDFTELIAALAPRPFLAVAPEHDDNFDVSGVRDVMDYARPIYGLYHRENDLQALYPHAGHSFPPEEREAAYAFLFKYLSSETMESP